MIEMFQHIGLFALQPFFKMFPDHGKKMNDELQASGCKS
jgi:hypothetical protein